MSWFEVDKGGLRQLLAGKDKSFIIRELVQNCWDEPGVTRVVVTIYKHPGVAFADITVKDDAPEGFYDIKHAYTLFADTRKRPDPEKRGRFNLGEKQVLSVCKEARISTTTGTVFFRENGTREQTKREKTDSGSEFYAGVRMTHAEADECVKAAMTFLPPSHIATTVNGKDIPTRIPIENTEATLTTEYEKEGVMVRTQRKTTIEVHKVLGYEKPLLYEMGLPVVELEAGDPWHINVCQRVPLNSDRDNVSPAFLRDVRAEVLNLMSDRITNDQAADAWVSEATEDERIESDAIENVMTKRFGENRVVADPGDPGSKERAIMAGYTIVPSRALSKAAWTNVREAGAVKPSSAIFGSVEVDAERVPPDEYTEGMATVAEIARRMVDEVQHRDVKVSFVRSRADSGAQWLEMPTPKLTFNVTRLGKAWFNPDNLNEQIMLIIHEMGHRSGGHLEASYINDLCRIGAKLFTLDRRALLVDINHRA